MGSLVVVQVLLPLAACRIQIVVAFERVVVEIGLVQEVERDTVVERLLELR